MGRGTLGTCSFALDAQPPFTGCLRCPLTCDLSFCARPAEYRPLLLTVHTLVVQIHTGHPRLAAALGFPIAGARGNLLEAQHCRAEREESGRSWPSRGAPSAGWPSPLTRVTGAAQLAGGEMVPVFVVGIMGARLAGCVLAVAAGGMDKLACEEGGGKRGIRRQGVYPCLLGFAARHGASPRSLCPHPVFKATRLPFQISVSV